MNLTWFACINTIHEGARAISTPDDELVGWQRIRVRKLNVKSIGSGIASIRSHQPKVVMN